MKDSSKLNFPTCKDHYNKHVEGICDNDFYKDQLERESNHWKNYHRDVKCPEDYFNIAKENVVDGNFKRKYIYFSPPTNKNPKGCISSNYQKENVTFKEKMDENEYEGLLTTCLNESNSKILTCFYRTMNYDIKETLTMVVSIYINNKKLDRSSIKNHYYGNEIKPFPIELINRYDDLFEIYDDVKILYNENIAKKVFLTSFLSEDEKIKKPYGECHPMSLVNDYLNCFFGAYKARNENEHEIEIKHESFMKKISDTKKEIIEEDRKKSIKSKYESLSDADIYKMLVSLFSLDYEQMDSEDIEENMAIIDIIREICTIRTIDYIQDKLEE